jgi:glycosyltransferase involved in cell wall biosynthesis
MAPKISVVVPAWNEESFLPRCLDCLQKQMFRDFEIIVVAGGQDATADIARHGGATVLAQTEKSIAKARQKGFDAAAAEIIASTDADTVVPENWLASIAANFEKHPEAGCVAGHFQLYDGPAFPRFWIGVSLSLMPAVLKIAPGIWSFGGFNFAVRKQAFVDCGGFDTNAAFGEDVDLCRRLKKQGKVIFDPGLVVRCSGRAFMKDPLGLNNLTNYFSVLVRGKPAVRVVHGSDIQSAKNLKVISKS